MKNCEVESLIFLSTNTFKLSLRRNNIKFKAGQCFSLGITSLGINREYSIYSGEEDDSLEFLIRIVDGGIVSNALSKLKVGDLVEINGPFGDFTIKEKNLSENHLFIASGTGIAPFHSFVKTYSNLKYVIYHGIRYQEEQYDYICYNKYIPCISQSLDSKCKLRVTDQLKLSDLQYNVIYLCGNQHMIYDAQEIIYNKYSNKPIIYTECFF